MLSYPLLPLDSPSLTPTSSLWLPIYCAVASPGADNFPRCHKNSKVCAMCAVYFRCKYLGFAQAGQAGSKGGIRGEEGG